WFWLGHSTFFSSAQDSWTKLVLRSASPGARTAGARPPRPRSASRATSGSLRSQARGRRRRRTHRQSPHRLRAASTSAASSAGLPVGRVLAAPAAVLAELDAVRIVPLRLHRLVVAPLAVGAGERDRNSDSCLCHEIPFASGQADAPPTGRISVAGP